MKARFFTKIKVSRVSNLALYYNHSILSKGRHLLALSMVIFFVPMYLILSLLFMKFEKNIFLCYPLQEFCLTVQKSMRMCVSSITPNLSVFKWKFWIFIELKLKRLKKKRKTTTTIFSPKTNKKTFTKVNLNNANFGEFWRIILQKCEAKAKRTTKLFMRIRFASLFFALMRIRNANLDPCAHQPFSTTVLS